MLSTLAVRREPSGVRRALSYSEFIKEHIACATHRAACAAPLLYARDSPGSLRCTAIVCARLTGQLALLRYCMRATHRAACAAPLLYTRDSPGSLRCSAFVSARLTGQLALLRYCDFDLVWGRTRDSGLQIVGDTGRGDTTHRGTDACLPDHRFSAQAYGAT
jgi:hypothetical protein